MPLLSCALFRLKDANSVNNVIYLNTASTKHDSVVFTKCLDGKIITFGCTYMGRLISLYSKLLGFHQPIPPTEIQDANPISYTLS